MGIIYILISPSGKAYIGQTTKTLEERVAQHCKKADCAAIYGAILKYGIENFDKEILYHADDDLLDELETEMIAFYKTLCPNGYNIRTGGSNGTHCEASREKMRQAKLGSNNHNFGKERDEQARQNISLAKRGEKHHFYGKELSYEHKLNLSKSHKSYDSPMYLVKIPAYPKKKNTGYAVVNHPILKNKYFTSMQYTDEEKLANAFAYLNSCETDTVQRLNGSG